MAVEVARTPEEVRAFVTRRRCAGRRVGFVPTMGALHEGHLSLVRMARADCDVVVVSIYVNPRQFAPSEDFDAYPRTFEGDRRLCEREGVDLIFCPTDAVMYPGGFATHVEVERLTEPLCGRSRPHFFRGVTTVVCKLLNIVTPDAAYFGWKDAQQAIVIDRMVKDLDLPVEIVKGPIVREPDGLALSSRNAYLDAGARKRASRIYAALQAARRAIEENGETDCATLQRRIGDDIVSQAEGEVDYVEIVSLDRLEPLERVQRGNTLIAVAVHLGGARLIDNIRV